VCSVNCNESNKNVMVEWFSALDYSLHKNPDNLIRQKCFKNTLINRGPTPQTQKGSDDARSLSYIDY